MNKSYSLIFSIIVVVFISCTMPNDDGNSISLDFNVIAINSGSGANGMIARGLGDSFLSEPSYIVGAIDSSAPEYMKITVTEILANNQNILNNEVELTLTQDAVDTSGIDSALTFISTEVDNIEIKIKNEAKIKGQVTGWFYTQAGEQLKTFYTKTAHGYNVYSEAGGSTDYSAYENGPSEETTVNLAYDDVDTIDLSFSLNNYLSETDGQITLLVDLNRMLRFSLSDGPAPPTTPPMEDNGKSFFFSHSVFRDSIALFVGTPGTIEGYEYIYTAYNEGVEIGSTTPTGIKGWMTLIFDPNGNLIRGNLVGDNDNDLTVAKGSIDTFETNETSIDFTYVIDQSKTFYVYGFERPDTIGIHSVTTWNGFQNNQNYHGEAKFTLRLLQ